MRLDGPADAYHLLYAALGRVHDQVIELRATASVEAKEARRTGAHAFAEEWLARVAELERFEADLNGLLLDFAPARLGIDA